MAAQDVPSVAPSAGPSMSSTTTSVMSSRKRGKQPAIPEEHDETDKLPLYRDDPEENDPEWQDDVEEFPSPPPRRMPTRAVPSASQPQTSGWGSDIEEVASPPPRQPSHHVTMIEKDDVEDFDDLVGADSGGDKDPEMMCKEELVALRNEVSSGVSAQILANACHNNRCMPKTSG